VSRRINGVDLEAVRVSHDYYLSGLFGDLLGDLRAFAALSRSRTIIVD